uniref:Uncharacterized protein n=1 Tax=Arundo donax TaxID=35708 RepID=A0A0A9EYG1_ARUDO
MIGLSHPGYNVVEYEPSRGQGRINPSIVRIPLTVRRRMHTQLCCNKLMIQQYGALLISRHSL